jgi:hypothetical protein
MQTDFKSAIEAVLAAGRMQTALKDRVMDLTVDRDGVLVTIPVTCDSNGNARVVKEALEYAREEQERLKPAREGSYSFEDFASLLRWSERYKTESTAAFLESPAPLTTGSVVVVIDELPLVEGGTHRKLTGSVQYGLHEDLIAWTAKAGQWLSAPDFYQLVDERSDAMVDSAVLTMASNIEIKSEATYVRQVDETGAVKVQASDKSGPVSRVPKTFQFISPVFEYDEPGNMGMTFTARLRMKISSNKPVFQYEIIDFPNRIREAVRVLFAEVQKVVPVVYMGEQPVAADD